MLEKGCGKDEIMEKTRHGVGVADANFTVNQGEILVVMGLSGSGKSTLVRCINRLIEPTRGKVIVDGEDVTQLSKKDLRFFRQKHFGMVFQNFALLPHRSVFEKRRIRPGDPGSGPGSPAGGGHEGPGAGGVEGLGGNRPRTSFPGACCSGWDWRARWLWMPTSCSWTKAFSALGPADSAGHAGRTAGLAGKKCQKNHRVHQPRPGRSHQAGRQDRVDEGTA